MLKDFELIFGIPKTHIQVPISPNVRKAVEIKLQLRV